MSAQPKWLRAVRLADDEKDTSELVAMLLSDAEMTTATRKLLADLFERHNLKNKQGRKRLPIYRRSLREVRVASAVAADRKLKKLDASSVRLVDGTTMSPDDYVRTRWDLKLDPDEPDQDKLGTALDGKRGSANRAKRRKMRTI